MDAIITFFKDFVCVCVWTICKVFIKSVIMLLLFRSPPRDRVRTAALGGDVSASDSQGRPVQATLSGLLCASSEAFLAS